jgi:DNA-binding IclR family transcriptional regulator
MRYEPVSRPTTAHRVLATIQTFQREHSRAPSLRELERITGLAYQTVYGAVLTLKRDYGYVRWERGRAGTLHVTEEYP